MGRVYKMVPQLCWIFTLKTYSFIWHFACALVYEPGSHCETLADLKFMISLSIPAAGMTGVYHKPSNHYDSCHVVDIYTVTYNSNHSFSKVILINAFYQGQYFSPPVTINQNSWRKMKFNDSELQWGQILLQNKRMLRCSMCAISPDMERGWKQRQAC